MTSNQKIVASWVAIAALLGAVLYLVWLYWRAVSLGVVDNPDGSNPALHVGWKVALWFIELGTTAKIIFATILTVLSTGIAAVVEIYQRKWQILSICMLCITGVILCIIIIVSLIDEALLRDLGFYSNFETNSELKAAADVFFYTLIGWFSLFMASQLGISASKAEGWLKSLRGGAGDRGADSDKEKGNKE